CANESVIRKIGRGAMPGADESTRSAAVIAKRMDSFTTTADEPV
ncbi:MAG: hypothetical protein QOE74_5264, partial [Mycobacterium sp.]|nr:hypothetical protein [Mycobacterium sp.]